MHPPRQKKNPTGKECQNFTVTVHRGIKILKLKLGIKERDFQSLSNVSGVFFPFGKKKKKAAIFQFHIYGGSLTTTAKNFMHSSISNLRNTNPRLQFSRLFENPELTLYANAHLWRWIREKNSILSCKLGSRVVEVNLI